MACSNTCRRPSRLPPLPQEASSVRQQLHRHHDRILAAHARRAKEIAKVAIEKDKSEAKLAKFGGSVPPAVVEQERLRLADWTAKLAALQEQRARL